MWNAIGSQDQGSVRDPPSLSALSPQDWRRPSPLSSATPGYSASTASPGRTFPDDASFSHCQADVLSYPRPLELAAHPAHGGLPPLTGEQHHQGGQRHRQREHGQVVLQKRG